MDFLKKIDYLLNKSNLNKNTLSKNCNIPYTTIDGWYKKGYEGIKLTTLNKLTEYFNVTLDYLVDEKIPLEPILYENSKIQDLSVQKLPKDKEKLLNTYDKLNEDGKEKAIERVEELTYIDKYKDINSMSLAETKPTIKQKFDLNQQRLNDIYNTLTDDYKEKAITSLIKLSIECPEKQIKKANENKSYIAAFGGGVFEIDEETAKFIRENAVPKKSSQKKQNNKIN